LKNLNDTDIAATLLKQYAGSIVFLNMKSVFIATKFDTLSIEINAGNMKYLKRNDASLETSKLQCEICNSGIHLENLKVTEIEITLLQQFVGNIVFLKREKKKEDIGYCNH
jgi:hypothetical protein